MLFGVGFARVGRMLRGVVSVSRGGVGVVGGFFVVAGFVVLGGFGVVFGGLRVVGGGVLVALGGFLRHGMGILGHPSGGVSGCLRTAGVRVGIAVRRESTSPALAGISVLTLARPLLRRICALSAAFKLFGFRFGGFVLFV